MNAGLLDTYKWWGIAQDTYHTYEALASAGHDEVLKLGDRDRCTHIHHSEFIRQGASPTDAVGRTAWGQGQIYCPCVMNPYHL